MIRVGVLRGGNTERYDDSLKNGAYVLRNLPRDRYEVTDIFVDTDGVWHLGGTPASGEKIRHRVDVIWNALHGFYGEDGKLGQMFETRGIPYTGASPLASAIAMNKLLTKNALSNAGISTPKSMHIEDWGVGHREEIVGSVAREISMQLSPPWVVQAVSRGDKEQAFTVKTRDELIDILFTMYDARIPTLIEEAVFGTQASVIVSSGFRGQDTYTFLPIHAEGKDVRIQPKESGLFQRIAREVHNKLGLGAYSRVNAAIDRRGNVHVLGIETLPMTHADAELHDALAAVGSSFAEFGSHVIESALGRK